LGLTMSREHKTSNPSSTNRSFSLLLPFKIVFSKWSHILIAFITALVFWIVSSIFDQLLFFSPIVIFYLPEDAVFGFILATVTAILLGIVVSMNIYIFRHTKLKIKAASFFSGSSLGVLSSTCASCSSLGFFLVSTLGAAGITASNFLSNYQTPLRLLSIALLVWAYYSIRCKLVASCKPSFQNSK
ncbi:MAG: hypothetical protein ABJB85_07815, partial [Nitrososphaerota archaeon]